ncbi:hypothetical protein NW070_06160 [Mycoplasmopsis cynos]|nr:hypothetical protein [Mycoplasmopsis cynos]UWV77261.1 hypothetical protein NW070_06160 [Mycoplasmopsis cynos]
MLTWKQRQAGVYWYGLNLDHTLYAGRYYYAGYNANDFTRKWKLNKEYWDKDYVNNKRRIKEFNVVYKSQKKDEELFKKEEYNNFISGRTATATFHHLIKQIETIYYKIEMILVYQKSKVEILKLQSEALSVFQSLITLKKQELNH